MTEERREHPAWRTSLLARRVPHPASPGNTSGSLTRGAPCAQEQMIDGRVSIHVHDAGLACTIAPRHAQDRLRGGALGARAGRTPVRCTDGCQAQRAGSLDHTSLGHGSSAATAPGRLAPPALGLVWCRHTAWARRAGARACRSCSRNASSPLAARASQAARSTTSRRAVMGLGRFC